MIHQPVLIDGNWQEANFPVSSFKAAEPLTGKQLSLSFPVSSFLDIDEMLQATEKSFNEITALTAEQIASFLNSCAREIENNSDEICQIAAKETGLDQQARLAEKELPRMVDQLQQAAKEAQDRSWKQAVIDTKNNIRSIRSRLEGPVVIFGPSNFPLAFNACGGGDFAAAIVAGNSVIAKGNPNHPHTSMKLAQIISSVIRKMELPKTLFQFFHDTTHDLGYRLAGHPMIGALSFTGSRENGLKLKESADRSGNTIFLEMSGVNPLFILPEALEKAIGQISEDLINAHLDSAGQLCTKPGIIFLKNSDKARNFIDGIIKQFDSRKQQHLLTDRSARNLDSSISDFLRLGATKLTKKEFYPPELYLFPNTVMQTKLSNYMKHSRQFQEEAFGPVILFVLLESDTNFIEVARTVENCLAISVFGSGNGDENIYRQISPVLRKKCGRLLNDKMPTGIKVSPAMVHGGPYPASGNSGFSAIGFPGSILRFTSVQCYENVKENRLPDELKNANPTGTMWRLVDHHWTQESI